MRLRIRLRRYTFEFFGADLELRSVRGVVDTNRNDLAAVDRKRPAILDDDTCPVDAGCVRDHAVADLQPAGREPLRACDALEAISRSRPALLTAVPDQP